MAKEVRNEERKRKRLRERAKQLTEEDLLQVLRLREERAAKRGEATEGASRPSGDHTERPST